MESVALDVMTKLDVMSTLRQGYSRYILAIAEIDVIQFFDDGRIIAFNCLDISNRSLKEIHGMLKMLLRELVKLYPYEAWQACVKGEAMLAALLGDGEHQCYIGASHGFALIYENNGSPFYTYESAVKAAFSAMYSHIIHTAYKDGLL